MLAYLLAATGSVVDQGKAIALALGIGLGSLGAGIGIGNIFGSMIQAVARQLAHQVRTVAREGRWPSAQTRICAG